MTRRQAAAELTSLWRRGETSTTMASDPSGQDKNFLETPPDDLTCLMCHSVARDPLQTQCCGKLYCKSCLERLRQNKGTCPTCRKRRFSTFSDQLSNRRIKALKVTCDNEEKGCKWTGELDQLERHIAAECMFAKIPCSNNCSRTLLRRNMQKHLKRKCPYREYKCRRINSLMVKCDNERKGCKWQSELSNLKGHITNCKFNMATCKHCSRKLPRKDVSKHHNECPGVRIVCPNPGCTVKEQRSKMPAHRSICPKEKVPSAHSTIGCEVTIMREGLQEHMEQHLRIAMNRIVVLEDVVRPQPLGVYKMQNYEKLKRNNEDWYSPCFYTHEGGYKMCMSVCVNGFSGGKGTHVSVYVHIMAGENDENLLWPFRGEITYELLNQLDDKNHKVQTMKYDTNEIEDHNYVADGGTSVGWGMPGFISHGALHHNPANNCQYLKDDCLFFRVTQAKVYQSNKPWLTPYSHD